LMEKPMTTDIEDAIHLFQLVQSEADGQSQFWINHTANYRAQTALARETITSGKLGKIRHVTASFASPLKWIFNDPKNEGWNKPTGKMVGNGFAWGQSSHLLAFLFHILPHCEPKTVHCRMAMSHTTGADIAHSATVECLDLSAASSSNEELSANNTVVLNMSGTALLPGHQYADPPIGKLLSIDVYGDEGSLHYSGNDLDPSSGHLEFRPSDGSIEVLSDQFEFEAYDNENYGPESIQAFVNLCCGLGSTSSTGATALDGLRSVQVIDAMYRSNASKQVEAIVAVATTDTMQQH
jgi:predicted dehydrogenase